MGLSFDLNCDMGESFGNYRASNDAGLMPFITSANIACGYHGGDAHHIRRTIELAVDNNVRIGAHPGYPDLQGFGRRKMDIPAAELSSMILYQVSALKGMVESLGGQLQYVKPHGALYHACAKSEKEANALLEAIRILDPELAIMSLPNSLMNHLCNTYGHSFIAEGFADRNYINDGHLLSRSFSDAVITEPNEVVVHVSQMVHDKKVRTKDGELIPMAVDSICLHGDNKNALAIANALHKHFIA